MTRARLLGGLRRRPIWATVLVVLAIALYQLWGAWAAASKLRAAGLDGVGGRVHVEVVVSIVPEQFHMIRFQNAGRLVEVRTPSVFLMDVAPEALRGLAGEYWVAEIRPWSGRR